MLFFRICSLSIVCTKYNFLFGVKCCYYNFYREIVGTAPRSNGCYLNVLREKLFLNWRHFEVKPNQWHVGLNIWDANMGNCTKENQTVSQNRFRRVQRQGFLFRFRIFKPQSIIRIQTYGAAFCIVFIPSERIALPFCFKNILWIC